MDRKKMRHIGKQDYKPEFKLLWHHADDLDAHELALYTYIFWGHGHHKRTDKDKPIQQGLKHT